MIWLFIGVCLLLPSLLVLFLKSKLRRNQFSLTVVGFFSFRNLSILIPGSSRELTLKASQLFLQIHNRRLLICLEGVRLLLADNPRDLPATEAPTRKLRGFSMLLVRILSIILSEFIEVKVNGLDFQFKHALIKEKFIALSFRVDYEVRPTQTAVLTMVVQTHSATAWLNGDRALSVCSVHFELVVPPNINLVESLALSTASLSIGVLDARLTFKHCLSLRHFKSSSPSSRAPPKAPKLLSVASTYTRVQIEDVVFEAEAITGRFKLPKETLGTLVCKKLIARGDHQILSIAQVDLEIIKKLHSDTLRFKLDTPKLDFSLDLASFIRASIIADRLDNEPRTGDKVPLILEFMTPEISVLLPDPQSQAGVLRASLTRTWIEVEKFGETTLKLECECVRLDSIEDNSPVLRVSESKVYISNLKEQFMQVVDFTCKDVRVSLHKAAYFNSFPAILAFADKFKGLTKYPSHKVKPKPDVRLKFSNILVGAYLEPSLGLEVRLGTIASEIDQRRGAFDLSFETTTVSFNYHDKFKLLWFESVRCVAHPDQDFKSFKVDLKGVEFIVPPQFQIGIGMYKAVKLTNKLIKWTEGLTSSDSYKTLKTLPLFRATVKASKVRFVIEESVLNKAIRKKEMLGADAPFDKIKAWHCGPFLLMSTFGLELSVSNQGLQSSTELLSSMQDLDACSVPDVSFFRLLMGFELKATLSSVVCQIRDYPYKFAEIQSLDVEGRLIISKNRLKKGSWATVKRHFKLDAQASGCELTIGLCLRPAMIELAMSFERLVLKRELALGPSKSLKFKSLDQMRYSNHGLLSLNLQGLSVALLNSLNPHEKSAVDMTLSAIHFQKTSQSFLVTLNEIEVVFPTFRPLLKIPQTELSVDYQFTCDNDNHWLNAEELTDYTSKAVKVNCNFTILEVAGQVLMATYEVQQASLLTQCLGMLINPPIIFLQTNLPSSSKKDTWLDSVEEITVDRAVIQTPRLLLVTAHGTGLQITVDCCNFTAIFERNRGLSVLPWIMKDAQGQASNIHMKGFDGFNFSPLYPAEFQPGGGDFYFSPEHTLMTCATIDYIQNYEGAQHSLAIQSFRLLFTKTLCDTLANLLIMDPKILPKLKRKPHQRTIAQDSKVTAPEMTRDSTSSATEPKNKSSLKFKLSIHTPQISLQNESSLAQMLIIASAATTEIFEEVLPFDRDAIDLKRKICISFASMETFVAPGMIDLGRPVFWLESTTELTGAFQETAENFCNLEGLLRRVFIARDFQCDIQMFRLPYYYYDFALNTIAQDKNRWNLELRTNKVEISLPDLQCSMESEHAWTVIDVIQNILVQRDSHPNESVNEVSKTEEIDRFGMNEVAQMLLSKTSSSNFVKRPRMLKHVTVSAPKISLRMTKNCEVMLAVELQRLAFTVDLFSDRSSQKILELHRVDVLHNGNTVLKPLVPVAEQYLDANCMFTLRLVDRIEKGKLSGHWQVFDHVEVFLFPLFIDITKAVYDDIYEFFFPKITELDDSQKEALLVPTHGKPKLKQRSVKKLKPLSKRRRLPGLFKYCHINEVKLELTVRGWISETKLVMEPMKVQEKFWTCQEMFDKLMKSATKSALKQLPSILLQSMGREKKDFLPARVSNRKSFFNLFKKKRSSDTEAFEEARREEDDRNWKLMFGSSQTKPY
jgi:hypothetical protein